MQKPFTYRPAMADYAARIGELTQQVLALQQAGGPGTESDVPATFIRLTAGIEAYGSTRDRAFQDGLAILKPDSSATAAALQEKWSEHFAKRGSEAVKQLLELTSRDSDRLQRNFELYAVQEGACFGAVGSMPVPNILGRLCEELKTLQEQTKNLEAKWSELAGLDERSDGQIAALRVQVLDAFKKGVEEVRGVAPKIEEGVRKLVDAWDRKEETDPEPSPSSVIKLLLETLGFLQRTLDEAVRQSEPLYAGERPIYEMFANVRAQVNDYLTRVNRDTMGRLYADACRATQDAADRCATDGQKADAKRLAEQAIAATQSTMSDFNSAWDKFYSTFDGRFVGAVNDQTVEFLADQEFFNRFWKDVEALNLPGELRSAADRLSRLESLDLDKVTPEQRQMFEVEIKARLREIQEQIRAMDSSAWERFKLMFITTPLSFAVDLLRKVPGFRK